MHTPSWIKYSPFLITYASISIIPFAIAVGIAFKSGTNRKRSLRIYIYISAMRTRNIQCHFLGLNNFWCAGTFAFLCMESRSDCAYLRTKHTPSHRCKLGICMSLWESRKLCPFHLMRIWLAWHCFHFYVQQKEIHFPLDNGVHFCHGIDFCFSLVPLQSSTQCWQNGLTENECFGLGGIQQSKRIQLCNGVTYCPSLH